MVGFVFLAEIDKLILTFTWKCKRPQITKAIFIFCLKIFSDVYLFILRERERAQAEEGQRERERENPKQAPSCQCRAHGWLDPTNSETMT